MAKRGRKSAAELALTDIPVVDVFRRMPPSPPSELTEAQAQVWRDAVSCMPGDWLKRGAHGILIEYCRHVCRSRLLEVQIAHFEQEWIAATGGLERASTGCWRWLNARARPQSPVHGLCG